ncbi:MAG TPA: RNA-binding protein [Candidatus Dependentiae bacterium]|nr:RNA-binding protein [Candidatus Dependentiae bacterium]HRQ62422.1 RNA-binding protein [Candidatus Dependentiae bacterium]
MKLYIGNLPYSATENELKDLFSQHGTVVSAKIITDKFTGQSKGFGFVEMSSNDEGNAAIQGANGADFKGRNIKVNEARPVQPRSNDRRSGGSNYNRYN